MALSDTKSTRISPGQGEPWTGIGIDEALASGRSTAYVTLVSIDEGNGRWSTAGYLNEATEHHDRAALPRWPSAYEWAVGNE